MILEAILICILWISLGIFSFWYNFKNDGFSEDCSNDLAETFLSCCLGGCVVFIITLYHIVMHNTLYKKLVTYIYNLGKKPPKENID